MSYASRARHSKYEKLIVDLLEERKMQIFTSCFIKSDAKTISYEALFAISGILPIDLVILNNLRSGKLFEYQPWHAGWTIPVSLLPHPSW
ncbi:hypothetical protein TNIN_369151 [Trichonephila inaurata madagascariensis]|uniref:Uncharacterized protein n=1 Tax=Trichonephila inaurata madagascariensis TaxID=2747483 RepID=A0A8X6WNE6_9ARAC|nr:hypothetical protein TNIN_369151 [Trichonephila inaurata madagascariensis]